MIAMAFISWFLLAFSLLNASAVEDHVVHCPWGTIQGVAQTSPAGKPYISYLGIPYAKPPVGDLRFTDPVPQPSPQGVFKTSARFGAMCPQSTQYFSPPFIRPPQSEDCLTLNVFTPSHSSSTPRTVMVWIHGGAWVEGNGQDMWKIVTEADVIGVSIQYRLGVLGFLSTGSKEARGNYAMLDQVLALKWIKENIAAFGGDDNNITIYGESAGGASVSFHTLSPLSKGLFKRAIMQSGTTPSYWSTRQTSSMYTYQVAKNMNCPVPPSERPDDQADIKMLECLRKLSFRTLIDKSHLDLPITEYSMDIVWKVVPDSHFLMDNPAKLIEDKQYLESVGFYDSDMMVGVNNAEGAYMLGLSSRYGYEHNVSNIDILSSQDYYTKTFLPTTLDIVYGQSRHVDIDALQYQSLDYEGYQAPYPLFNHTARSVLEQVANIGFIVPAQQIARSHSAHSASGRTYMYYFDHYPSYMKNLMITGMAHGSDVNYLFGFNETLLRRQNLTVSPEEHSLSDTFVQMLADFAKTGDPNPALKSTLSTKWTEFSQPDESYLSLSTNMSVKQHLRKKGVDVWLDLIPKLHKDLKLDCNAKDAGVDVPIVG